MKRRKQKTPSSARPDTTFRHAPFRDLAKSATVLGPRSSPSSAPPAPNEAAPVAESDVDLFQREMADVARLPERRRQFVPRLTLTPPRKIADPDADVIEELCRLVGGDGTFDISDTTEYIEGVVAGVDRRLVRRLRKGEFAYQSHLDLHGLTAAEAREEVNCFLTSAQRRGQRCVLIVHGRGLNSKDQVPVLKHRLAGWLSRTSWARLVLAFTTARPCDGGAGALYVLLRRERAARRPVHVTEGAKW